MPRKRQHQPGGQPNGYTPPGPDYAPGSAPPPAPAPDAIPSAIPADGTVPAAPVDPLARATEALRGQAYQPLLGGPSPRPDIPITAGLPSGPGPGPEILGQQTSGRITALLQRIASTSSDPILASLADEAAAQNI